MTPSKIALDTLYQHTKFQLNWSNTCNFMANFMFFPYQEEIFWDESRASQGQMDLWFRQITLWNFQFKNMFRRLSCFKKKFIEIVFCKDFDNIISKINQLQINIATSVISKLFDPLHTKLKWMNEWMNEWMNWFG